MFSFSLLDFAKTVDLVERTDSYEKQQNISKNDLLPPSY